MSEYSFRTKPDTVSNSHKYHGELISFNKSLLNESMDDIKSLHKEVFNKEFKVSEYTNLKIVKCILLRLYSIHQSWIDPGRTTHIKLPKLPKVILPMGKWVGKVL